MVIDERHADRLRAFAQRVHHVGERLVVVRAHGPILRLLVDDLEHLPARVAHELRVREVEVDLRLPVCRLVLQVAAREDGEGEAALREQVLQHPRTRAVRVERRRAELDALESDLGDLVDRLRVVAAPRNRRVADADLSFRLQAEGPRERAKCCEEFASSEIRHARAPWAARCGAAGRRWRASPPARRRSRGRNPCDSCRSRPAGARPASGTSPRRRRQP